MVMRGNKGIFVLPLGETPWQFAGCSLGICELMLSLGRDARNTSELFLDTGANLREYSNIRVRCYSLNSLHT